MSGKIYKYVNRWLFKIANGRCESKRISFSIKNNSNERNVLFSLHSANIESRISRQGNLSRENAEKKARGNGNKVRVDLYVYRNQDREEDAQLREF